jgi:hypothetical protein
MNIGGLPPFSYDELQKNIGGLVYPNGISPDGMSQEQMFRQGVGQLGAGMLANSTKNPMQALGMSYLQAQNQGLDNSRQVMFAKEFKDKQDERKYEREAEALRRQQSAAILRSLGMQDNNIYQGNIEPQGQVVQGAAPMGNAGGPSIDRLYEAKAAFEAIGDNDKAQAVGAMISQIENRNKADIDRQKLDIDRQKVGIDQTNQTLKVIEKPYEDASSAAADLNAINDMNKLLDEGIFSGRLAGWQSLLTGVMADVGWASREQMATLSNTESYMAVAGKRVAEIINQFGAGTGLSDNDREYASKMAAGQIEITEASMRKILSIGSKVNKSRIQKYKKSWEPLIGQTQYGESYRIDKPEEYAPLGAVVQEIVKDGITYQQRENGEWYAIGGNPQQGGASPRGDFEGQ